MDADAGNRSHRSQVWRTGIGMAAVTLTVTSLAAAQTPTFDRHDYASFSGARAIVTADFNRDGWPDVAHANTGRNSVTILLNQAGTGFVRTSDVAVGAGPFDLATADFNRDGIPDLAVANADGDSLSVLIGSGSGGFSRADISVPAQNPRGITTADVNKDGKPDLIYSAYATGQVQVLLGNGAGGFTMGSAYASSPSRAQGVATGDFNRDGNPDIAVAYASGAGLRILFGNGAGAFTARAVPGGSSLNVLATGDFDRDGWTDIAAASTASSSVAIYLGSPGGLRYTQTRLVGASPRGIAVGDLNGDGLLDIVTANRASSAVSVLLGDGAHPGTFLDRVDVGAGSGSRAAAVADFDGDARLDVAAANELASSTTVLLNDTFLLPAGYAFRHVALSGATFPEASTGAVTVADFDRDGRLDRAAQAADTALVVVMLAAGGTTSLPIPGYLKALTAADVNGDGNQDLIFDTQSPDAVGTYLGDGHGGFTKGPATAWIFANTFAAADMNRDGRVDLVSEGLDMDAGTWVLQVGLGKGDGTFATVAARAILPDHASDIALADVNRDGRLDVVAVLLGFSSGGPSEARVWFGTAAGGLTESTWTVRFIHSYGVSLDLDDVNRDGYLDIVASEHWQMGVALGSAGGFATPVYSPVTAADLFLGPVAIGDLNADGRADAAFASGDVVFGNGDGSFAGAGRFDYGPATTVQIADFTGDGLPDIMASAELGIVVIGNTREHTNRPPTVNAGPDRTFGYGDTQGEDCEARLTADAIDPDAHGLTYEWKRNAEVVSTSPAPFLCGPPPGTYVYSVTVRDGRGGAATDSITVVISTIEEIVLWAANASAEGRWQHVDDPTAAGGIRVYDPNLGAPKVTTPTPEPTDKVSFFRFFADPNLTYKLWIRLKADGNSWANDSVWVQFSDATDLAGGPKYRIGTNSGLAVNLEECSGCGISGWGWEDDGWGAPDRNGVMLRFPQNPDRDPHVLVVQTREDGVSIDQIVLSAVKYATARPGKAKNDTTILRSTQPPR